MQTTVIVVLAVLVVVLAVALIASRTKATRSVPPPSGPPPGLALEASQLVAAGRAIHAIKLVRERTGWNLTTSKAFVDRLGGDPDEFDEFDEDELADEVRALLAERKVVHAVKLVRESTGWDLATAKGYVDRLRGRR